MRTLRLTLAYDGTAYSGWQAQPGQPTVQGMLDAAIQQVTGQKPATAGSGRTDAGVHALGQVASFQTDSHLSVDVLRRALNARLPHDIAVLEVAEVAPGFHATRHALRKCYRYLLSDTPIRDIFHRPFYWHYRFGQLAVPSMHRAAQALVGTHDFRSFQSSGSPRDTTVRTIFRITVQRLSQWPQGRAGDPPIFHPEDSPDFRPAPMRLSPSEPPTGLDLASEQGRAGDSPTNAPWIILEVEGNGFLYNMVRVIVGTLVQVGSGTRTEDFPAQALRALDRRAAGPTAPPQGLFLVRVDYPSADPPSQTTTTSHGLPNSPPPLSPPIQ